MAQLVEQIELEHLKQFNFFSKLAELNAQGQMANFWTCFVEHKL